MLLPARSMPPGLPIPSGRMFWLSCPLPLNRVYTEWYRNLGYDFTITSSTAFDHKWIPERNIYADISVIVDELFSQLSVPARRAPAHPYPVLRRAPGPVQRMDDPVGIQSSRRPGLFSHPRSCGTITGMICTSILPNPFPGSFLLAGKQSGSWVQGQQGPADAGRIEHHRGRLSGSSENRCRRHLWSGHPESGPRLPVCPSVFPPPGSSIILLVQNFRDLCGSLRIADLS